MSKKNSLILLFLIGTLLPSFVKSTNKLLSFHQFFHFFIWIIFALIIIHKIKTFNNIISYIKTSILSGLAQSVIAILQFLKQSSIGLSFLGESLFAPNILGVAKIDFTAEKIIRVYGTQPHPNILAAFLFMNLVFLWFFLINKQKNPNCSTWNILKKSQKINQNKKIYLKNKTLITLIFLLYSFLVIALFLTFSRSIIFFFIIFILLIQLFHVEQLKQNKKILYLTAFLLLSLLIIFYPLLKSRINEKQFSSANQNQTLRETYKKIANNFIYQKPLTGIGAGNFVLSISHQSLTHLKPWEIQPVHNIYLLLASELGLITLSIALFLLYFILFHVEQYSNFHYKITPIKLGIIILLTAGLFDHYLYSFSQGNAILAFIFAIWISLIRINTKLYQREKFQKFQIERPLFKNTFI
ncbi:MAG: O-antigen ligase family protein [Patescibacteria group bacterium]